uniref:penicillin acylase family protein n=1 Tax=Fulvivirga sp. TaxID=1931237 RepID=UPI00404ABA7D
YVAFENELSKLAVSKFVPEAGKPFINRIQLKRVLDWVTTPDGRFGANPVEGRNEFLKEAFNNGIAYLEKTLGDDMSNWQYGQEKFKHTYIAHALGEIVKEDIKAKLDVGPLPRGGNSSTPGSTGGNNRQSSGASFRIIVNTGDWDAAVGTNGPGQSGNPESPFYNNLFEPWAKDQYFPVYYSREKVEAVAVDKVVLSPKE